MALQTHLEQTDVGGGGGISVFSATLAATFQIPSNSLSLVTGWTGDIVDAGFSFDGSTLTIANAGRYKITFVSQSDQYSGNNRSSTYTQVRGNGSLIKGMESICYNRQSTHGFDPLVSIKTVDLPDNYQLEIFARNHDATRLHQLLANGTVWEVHSL